MPWWMWPYLTVAVILWIPFSRVVFRHNMPEVIEWDDYPFAIIIGAIAAVLWLPVLVVRGMVYVFFPESRK